MSAHWYYLLCSTVLVLLCPVLVSTQCINDQDGLRISSVGLCCNVGNVNKNTQNISCNGANSVIIDCYNSNSCPFLNLQLNGESQVGITCDGRNSCSRMILSLSGDQKITLNCSSQGTCNNVTCDGCTTSNFLCVGFCSFQPNRPVIYPLSCNDTVVLNNGQTKCFVSTPNTTISSQIFSLFNYSVVEFSGSITLSNMTSTTLLSGQSFTAESVTFGGILGINLTESDLAKIQNGDLELNISQYNSSIGSYNSIQINNENSDSNDCGIGRTQSVYGEHSLSVIVTGGCQTTTTGDGGVNKGLVIGIVLGIFGFVLLLLLVFGIITGVLWYLRSRARTLN